MSSKYQAYKKNAVSNKEYLEGYDRIDWDNKKKEEKNAKQKANDAGTSSSKKEP